MNKSVALVLASGGARGMAHIGVIEELEKLKFKISSIAGSSFGSVVGGIYAAGHLKEFRDWLLQLDKIEVFKLMDFTLSKHGFIKGNRVFREISSFITDIQIEDLPIPFTAVAVDPYTHSEVIFRKGSLMNAIRASVAIPSIIEPYCINGIDLIDGGVLNPVPLDLVQKKDNDIVVAVNVNSLIPYENPVKKLNNEKDQDSLLKKLEFKENWDKWFNKDKNQKEKFSTVQLLAYSYDMMQNKITNLTLEKYPPDILVNISKNACSTFDFFKAAEIINLGRNEFKKAMAAYLESKKRN
ncbi:MAG: patatin-like phospholipase family protein [Bacteroidales bacterium]